MHSDSLGPVSEQILAPVRQLGPRVLNPMPAVALVPLEQLVVPSQFDGAEGWSTAPAQ